MVYLKKNYNKKQKKKYYAENKEYILEMRKVYWEEVKSGKRKVKSRVLDSTK